MIYWRITGKIPDPGHPSGMDEALNTVAHAVSNVVSIYTQELKSERPRPIEPLQLIEGTFSRGAQVFIDRSGRELRWLSVQRRDIAAALSILQSAHINFGKQQTDD